MIFKYFDLLSFTKVEFFVNPYSFKKFCKFLDNVYPKVLDVSKQAIIACFSTQSSHKKFTTNAKTSCAPLDIQRLKLAITKTQSIKTSQTNVCFVFSIRSGNIF
jgi:hypothetical protein